MKKWYSSKTVWFNIITTAIALATELSNANFPTADLFKVYMGVITLGNIILRVFFTSQPVGSED
jgi:hypothetical protein